LNGGVKKFYKCKRKIQGGARKLFDWEVRTLGISKRESLGKID
jgi:hypothetical protein